ncbi:heparan-alpha-glucosaminide N-acetyltransferase [Methylobacterium sp. JK268]
MVDAARGAALVAMALYHTTWDLGFLRLTPENAALTPLGRAAAHGIAGSFLLLVGWSLVLAQGRAFRPRAFLGRLARVGVAAAAISLATLLIFPDSWIFFGVLHCIALSSLLALPALRLPPPFVAAAGLAVIAAPAALRWSGAEIPVLDAPGLLFLGLARAVPSTNDYVPLFPWFGCVLLGVALGRWLGPRLAASRLGAWRPASPGARLLAGAGRHSLALYLVHQPALLAVLSGVALLTGPHPRAGEAGFRRDYEQNCAVAGGRPDQCRAAARCLLGRLRDEGLWEAAGRGALAPEQRARAVMLSRACFAEQDPPAPRDP